MFELSKVAKDDPELKDEILKHYLQAGTVVKFQWSFAADGETSELTYMDPEPWDLLWQDAVLEAIYK
ncbi:MAG: hypothetical protein EXR85_08460 [Xanthomonadales bacterium]|nr:hypothetical protein [Xanthomonadales bacterium]